MEEQKKIGRAVYFHSTSLDFQTIVLFSLKKATEGII
jgi:hypothetical protein